MAETMGQEMWARRRIDIGWLDLWYGFRCSFWRDSDGRARQCVESAFTPSDQTLACLSVRSGFDLLLSALQLPQGSEVLVSAVTISDMVRIIESHGLIAVPIDFNPETMQPDADALRRAITPRTQAVLVAHLFGTLLNLDDLIAVAKDQQLLFIEDCAQAFDGTRYAGHPSADIVMFSFGPIKTATALSGGLLVVRDAAVQLRMRAIQDAWPEQPAAEFRARLRRYSVLKCLSGRSMFAMFVRVLGWLDKDLDETLQGAVRNFPADHFYASLRRRPCAGVLRLMNRRIERFDFARQDRRARMGSLLCESIRSNQACAGHVHKVAESVPAALAAHHTWWLFPYCSSDRPQLIDRLRVRGFDSTCRSHLHVVPIPKGSDLPAPKMAQQMLQSMLFVPLYPEMPDQVVKEIADLITAGDLSSSAVKSTSQTAF